ncbi:glycoside hydrolase family 55 protein [Serpula lacrymans var. lacrymans S7.3]|uniref:Glycoside hydrolase family 55 protein n=2 Tax=Serpula lacrymans var. lacrymans TaxID=341189 RepID=F8QFJ1_SERL3|nr:glycoside hydrolase family 55 protein [Serpula lacrymans var. lacrymans S7.9]EGN92975.1 glycoside hydrolase family 55 protein [Serpula lacrymans var. lacrymans S7.3]EGO19688.1 glycoside hydrolase family 55 protein [Serpula lacrymans var. lacrymans S7.9]
MFSKIYLLLLSTVLGLTTQVSGLGSSCSAPLGGGTASPSDPFWMETITHQGTSAFNSNPSSYQVFRNVKDFGAKGDGVTDDTAAINSAMSSGGRCGGGSCASSTLTPAIVYFPSGTYVVSSAIDMYYYTQMIGDAKNPPTLLASSGFSGFAVIDADPYVPNGYGAQWYTNQDNFYRSIRNLVIDLRQMPATTSAIGLHWQVSQATSLMNIVVEMSTASGNSHQGMFMENGSGGFMDDLVFNGGQYGIQIGNQQFTVRNLTINNAQTAVSGIWNWGWTFQGVTINNCQVGFALATGGTSQADQTVGSEAIIDAVVTNTPIFIQSSVASNGKLAGSLVLNNIQLNNVPTAVGVTGGAVVLNGGTTTIASWGQGNVFSGTSGNVAFTQGNIPAANKASSLLDSSGRVFQKTHPQYAAYATSQFVSVKSSGAKGDGHTDDTTVIQNVINEYAGCKIIFFDAGTYYVTNTITVPAGAQIVGEAWSVILAGGSAFSNQDSPTVVFQAGTTGSQGVFEVTDMIFSTAGAAPGAIMIEWNVHDPSGQQGAAGMWDTHLRSVGTNMQSGQCPAGSENAACQAAFLGIHLTSGSSAYFEGTWVWTADHDLDSSTSTQTSIFTGRGILSQSAGPVWLIGTSEHAALYQYNLAGAQDHWIGFAQTETPYYQPTPAAPAPFFTDSAYNDPTFSSSINTAWGMYIETSQNIVLFGAGFYNFFQNYGQSCLTSNSCQTQIFNIDSASAASVGVYSVSTIGSTYQLSVAQNGVVTASSNLDGYQDTLTAWST